MGTGHSPESPTAEGPEPRLQDSYWLIRSYAFKHNQPRLNLDSLAEFVQKYAEHYAQKYPRLQGYRHNTKAVLIAHAQSLAASKQLSLDYENEAPVSIYFSDFYLEVVRTAWRELTQEDKIRFLNEDRLEVDIPADLVTPVNIKTDFVGVLRNTDPKKSIILRLIFPEDIPSLIITSDFLHRKLLEYAVYKIRLYLTSRNNAGYVLAKLVPLLRGNEPALRECTSMIATKPNKAVSDLLEPTDFSFRFWAHFANLVIQEFKEKREKLAEEYGYCQAAYLLGFYNVYYRGVVQQKAEKQSVIRSLETRLRKPPYAFSLTDLYTLKDGKGIPLIRRVTREAFTEFLEGRTKPDGQHNLPWLIKIKTAESEEYYIQKDLVIPFFIKKLYETAQAMKEEYIREWEALLRRDRRTPVMIDDLEFVGDFDRRLRSKHPLFEALLRFELLFLAAEEVRVREEFSRELERCFNHQKNGLRPATEILGLKRRELLKETRFRLPFWQRLSPFKVLIGLFRRIFLGFRKSLDESKQSIARERSFSRSSRSGAGKIVVRETPGSQESATTETSSAQQRANFKRVLYKLQVHFIGTHMTIPERLSELSEKWNPLFDPVARQNLVEDVNAMIRDFIRGLRKGFRTRPPDARRIESLAEQLAGNRAFERIKRKEYFRRYIEVYILKLLGEL